MRTLNPNKRERETSFKLSSTKLIDENEKLQLTDLIKRYYPTASKSFIESRTTPKSDFEIVLLNKNNKIVGANYYAQTKQLTPFSKKCVPVIHMGQVLKHPNYKGNTHWTLGHWYAKNRIGKLYPFKKVVGVGTVHSPKVLEHFSKLYHISYPYPNIENPLLLSFLNDFFLNFRKMDIEVDEQFCLDRNDYDDVDITDDWEKVYKAKNPEINNLFFEKGVMKKENDRIFKTSKAIVVCGYRNVFNRKKAIPNK